MARDTVRLGIALRGTLGAWLASWGASIVAHDRSSARAATALILVAARRRGAPRALAPASPCRSRASVVAAYCFWVDFVESRSLQAAPPDTCFIHGVVHALHDGGDGQGLGRAGASRCASPIRCRRWSAPAHRPNVLLVITESVRADAMCSAPPPGCKARFLDDAAPDRIALGQAHVAVVGHVHVVRHALDGPRARRRLHDDAPRARPLGGRARARATARRTSARRTCATTTSARSSSAPGSTCRRAPSTSATRRTRTSARRTRTRPRACSRSCSDEVPAGTPYFAVLHLSNTHWPYRVDPDAAALRRRTTRRRWATSRCSTTTTGTASSCRSARWRDFVRALRATARLGRHGRRSSSPTTASSSASTAASITCRRSSRSRCACRGGCWRATARSTPAQRERARRLAERRTYSQDVHATVLDLLGVLDQRRLLPVRRPPDRAVARCARPAREEPTRAHVDGERRVGARRREVRRHAGRHARREVRGRRVVVLRHPRRSGGARPAGGHAARLRGRSSTSGPGVSPSSDVARQ